MTTTGKLTLNGLSNYLEDLAAAGQDVDAAAQQALMAGAEVIAAEMDRLVPKDTHHLESTIGVDGPHQHGNFSYVSIGVVNADKQTAIYGNVQEYGSSSVEAQPYIRPAFKVRKAAAMKVMKNVLKEIGFL
jgi:HK97 gp10 family phage protein